MGKNASATVHPGLVNGVEPGGAVPMKTSLAQREIVHVRWRRPLHLHMHLANIVHELAVAGMGLEPTPVRHVNGLRRDIVDGSATVVWKRHLPARVAGANVRFGDVNI